MPAAASAGDITLTQADGSIITLEEPAQRIVTLAPHLAELVYAAGGGDRLLATVWYRDEWRESLGHEPLIVERGRFEFTGQANMAHVVGGKAATPGYHPDAAMFVEVKGGLLLEASVGTQRYDYFPVPN